MTILQIIVASVRQGRGGAAVAKWFQAMAEADARFKIEVLDLADIALPMSDEPNHPRLKQYVHEHTWKWSAMVERGDAFVIVTPEYNHSFPAPLKNALDYLHQEWVRKPVAIISYGGISSGLRSAQHLKTVLLSLGMVPIQEYVAITWFKNHISEDGQFNASDAHGREAIAVLNSLERWCMTLRRGQEREDPSGASRSH